MKIIICSEKDSVRKRWQSMLFKHNFSVYQASSLQTLQTIVHKNEQYLILIHQPLFDLQTISTLCKKNEFYKVFVFSDNPRKEGGLALLQRGVAGYANTYISEPRFIEAIKTVASGRVWFGQEIIAMLIKSLHVGPDEHEASESAGGTSGLDMLSDRENEIAFLVSEGKSNRDIGEKLYISERTVKSHLGTIFNKTGASSRLQLALLILRSSRKA